MNRPKIRALQQRVLDYERGKMAVSAVPGSGKTFTLSLLAAKLIEQGLVGDGQEVLVVTFSNSAVDNFSDRISSFVQQKGLLPRMGYRVRTLHGLAHDIIRERPDLAGLPEHFQIVDERESEEILGTVVHNWLGAHKEFLYEWTDPSIDLTTNSKVRNDWLSLLKDIARAFIHQAKDLQQSPQEIQLLLQDLQAPQPLVEMGLEMYAYYQRGLSYRSAVDFDDLIRLATQALNTDPSLLENLQFKWPYILEDEAQDSSRLQQEILSKLAGENGNWVRMGDPNQAIYESFTTSDPKHLLTFLQRADVTSRVLPNSGRSTRSIINLANFLIDWTNQEHPVEDLRDGLREPLILPTDPDDVQPNPTDNPEGIKLLLTKYKANDELSDVVKSLKGWLKNHPHETVAVLVPSNRRGGHLVEQLKLNNIQPVEMLRNSHGTRTMAEALRIVLEALEDPDNPAKLKEAYRKLREKDASAENGQMPGWISEAMHMLAGCKKVEEYLWPTPEVDWLETLSGSGVERAVIGELEVFRDRMARWHKATLLPIDQLILTLAQDIFELPSELALAHKLALLLERIAANHPDWSLLEFIKELQHVVSNERKLLGFGEEDTGFVPDHYPGRVVVTTMHKAKGLEWDRVYLLSVNNFDFPSAQPDDHYLSEKWYVRGHFNMIAETVARLKAVVEKDIPALYLAYGSATAEDRLSFAAERLRLLYVGITRARKELIVTWNTGHMDNCTAALPLIALCAHLEDPNHARAGYLSVQPE